MKKKVTPGKILYWSAASVWFMAAAFPLYFTFISSFKDNSQIFSAFLVPTFQPVFENYVMAQKMAGILRATANSLLVSISAIAIMLLFCTMAGYVTARKKVPFASAFSGLLIAALMIPIQSAIVPIVQFGSEEPPVDADHHICRIKYGACIFYHEELYRGNTLGSG